MGNDQKAQEQLGRKLKQARENKKLTQEEVANLVGLSVNYYARIERGEENPSLKRLRKIKEVLNVTIQL